uniref:uncharacterized protein LOC127064201 n=1 Tax=Vespula vulgaris TaxID=7454 RepID=UPI00211FF455|nr:uncharacterized protein LOC127064201 [Vespula vulgaris]
MNTYHQNLCESSSEEISKNLKKNSNMKHIEQTWIKKIETDKPKKYRPTLNTTYKNFENNIYKVPLRVPVMFNPPSQTDLETVIREFENNFLKPTEVDTSNNSTKNKSFVKKIVAAFEEKYKAYNESKIEEDVRAILDNRELFRKIEKTSHVPTKNLNTFASTSKICRPGSSKENDDDTYASFSSSEKKEYGKNLWKSTWPSSFKSSTPKESKFIKIMTDRYHPEEELPSGINDDELNEEFKENFAETSKSLKMSQKNMNLGKRLNFDNDRKYNTELQTIHNDLMIEEVKIVASTSRNRMHTNLKKELVEEEEADIDWSPPIEKELSRKKPLKKLLSKLAIVKKSKKGFIFQNVNKEFQDSGYDEMYLSSSSSNKSTSENSRSSFFRKKLYPSKSRKSAVKKSNEALKKITNTDLATDSMDKKSTVEPMTSTYYSLSTLTIPKYIFDNSGDSSITVTETGDTSAIKFSSTSSLSACVDKNCSTLEADELEELKKLQYPRDVPTKFFSQSDSRINELRAYNDTKEEELLYNLPKPRRRPATTSFYEDVLSLRRRMGSIPNFYSCPEHDNPSYATIKRGHKCKFCDNDRQRLFDEIQPDLNTSL